MKAEGFFHHALAGTAAVNSKGEVLKEQLEKRFAELITRTLGRPAGIGTDQGDVLGVPLEEAVRHRLPLT